MPLGLGRPQSVGNLTRRVDLALSPSSKIRRTVKQIEAKIAGRSSQNEHAEKKETIAPFQIIFSTCSSVTIAAAKADARQPLRGENKKKK